MVPSEPLCSAEPRAGSPVELLEECAVLEGVQLVAHAALVVAQLGLEALDYSGLTVLSAEQFPVVVVAVLVAAAATAAAGLLLT